jgi:preprotein translocase subunit SecE
MLEFAALRPYLALDTTQGFPVMAVTNPLQFIQQTRAEVAKVVWPTRREVLLTSVMVLIMSMLTAVFFFFVDWAIRTGLQITLTSFGS